MAAGRVTPTPLGHYLLRTQTAVATGVPGILSKYLNLGGHAVRELQKRDGSGDSSRGPKCRTGELVPGRVRREGTGDK